MKKIISHFIFSFLILTHVNAEKENASVLDTTQLENLTGAKGELDSESHVFKVSLPQPDLKASAAGVKLTPALGLRSWAAFKSLSSEGEVRGDIILFEDQINLVLKEALENGLNITGLHNHYLWDSPRIMFMRVEGRGPLKDLAMAVGKTFEMIKISSKGTIWMRPPAIINPERSTLNSKNIEDLLEKKGTLKDGVYKLTWERNPPMQDDWGSSRGANTWAAFAGTDKEAIMLGDVAMKKEDVQNVLKILLKHNIFITSLHQHIMEEDPRIMFVHYMGRGPAFELAKALKEVLEETNLLSTKKLQDNF